MQEKMMYRDFYIYTRVEHPLEEDFAFYEASVYNNRICFGVERSYISEDKAIEKAKKFIDELLEEE